MNATLSHLSALSSETVWIIVGFVGQTLFFMRFFVQWLASEKAGRSVIPNAFWYFSLTGGVTLFAYALWRQDPVFILGQSTGLLIYARNLYFIRKQPEAATNSQ
jgi:lipid-A-disaccharide synthase-like uncharacterized protein